MCDYLRQYREEVPEWLTNYKPGDDFSFDDVVEGRLAYYPGFGRDGSMLYVGNKSHIVHSFIHTDYLNNYFDDVKQLKNIAGYHSIAHVEWDKDQIFPQGRKPHGIDFKTILPFNTFLRTEPYHYITEILERNSDKDDNWGAKRIVVTILTEDGIDYYFHLFIRKKQKPPFLFLLQDHGLGCNYDRFGKEGLLEFMMRRNNSWPRFVMADNKYGTRIWDGYKRIEGIHPHIGGMHCSVRHLWEMPLQKEL